MKDPGFSDNTFVEIDHAQDILPDADFNAFLDQLMYSLYDNVIGTKNQIQFVQPSLTIYMRDNYDKDYQVATHPIPPTEADKQIETLMYLGASAANIMQKKTHPVAVFLVTMGQKQKSATDQGDTDTGEAVLILGMSVDGRVCQAIYDVKRNEKSKAIAKIDLKAYVPTRQAETNNSKIINPLLEAFYTGFTTYREHSAEAPVEDKENRNGDIILPD